MGGGGVCLVDEDLCRLHSGKLLHLRVRGFERVPIVGVAVQGCDANYPTALGSRHHRHFASELVLLVLFPFRDAFNFRCLHAVELVLVCPLLPIDARRSLQILLPLRTHFTAARCRLSRHIAHHPPPVTSHLPRLFPRSLQLLRVRVTALFL